MFCVFFYIYYGTKYSHVDIGRLSSIGGGFRLIMTVKFRNDSEISLIYLLLFISIKRAFSVVVFKVMTFHSAIQKYIYSR